MGGVRLACEAILGDGDGVFDIRHAQQRRGEVAVDRRDIGRPGPGAFQMKGGRVQPLQAQHHRAQVEGDFRILGQQAGGVGEGTDARRQVVLGEDCQGSAFHVVFGPRFVVHTRHGEMVKEFR